MFFRVFCVVFMFEVFAKKKNLDNGVGGCGPTNPSFSRIFLNYFNLTKPLSPIAIIVFNPFY